MARKPRRGVSWKAILERLRRLWRPKPELPEDPYAYRMARLRRGPKGRSGAAVVELDE